MAIVTKKASKKDKVQTCNELIGNLIRGFNECERIVDNVLNKHPDSAIFKEMKLIIDNTRKKHAFIEAVGGLNTLRYEKDQKTLGRFGEG